MRINTRSWHYKLWEFTYSLSNRGAPERTNLCAYVQRMIWLTLPVALISLVMLIVWMFFYHLWYALASLWFLFWGEGYPNYWDPDNFELSEFIKRTDGLAVGRFKLYPYRFLLPALAVSGLVWGWVNHSFVPFIVVGGLVGIGLIVWLVWLFQRSRRAETYRVVTTYLRAKKEKVCPRVEFTSGPTEPGPTQDLRKSGFKFGDAGRGNPEDRSPI